MKKLKSIFALLVVGFITMSMGFPTDLMNGRIISEGEKEAYPSAIVSNVIVMTTAKSGKENMQKEPIRALSVSHTTDYSAITVKVFDAQGSLVMKQQVSMDEFLASSKKIFLPTGSTFVMFHENTAYYFLEAGLMN